MSKASTCLLSSWPRLALSSCLAYWVDSGAGRLSRLVLANSLWHRKAAQRATAQLTPNSDASQVQFGSRVTIESDEGRRDTLRDEADPKRGTLSYVSPLAQALIDREVGDAVEVGGKRRKIVGIA